MFRLFTVNDTYSNARQSKLYAELINNHYQGFAVHYSYTLATERKLNLYYSV
jgi:hypothetical protein